ncbi:GNAT family N-acetyltransferase [Guptibacillus sedimenti]|uniref:GNAT family N-acetyltransferase n=1 Tax=Guptibacillus sedimenti TaxID=3025680 RepID=UPI00235FD5FE|nr:GNAT family N-acetyltransferase [Pseudalkalibacillus sedimenti]
MDVRVVKTEKEKSDAFKVRHTVFVDEQNVPSDLEIDEHDNDAIHFVAYDKSAPVAAGRFRVLDNMGKVERICVLGDYRGTGLGLLLMSAIETHAKDLSLKGTKLNAQISAVGFYEKLGYEVISDQFMDAGIPHVTMTKNL